MCWRDVALWLAAAVANAKVQKSFQLSPLHPHNFFPSSPADDNPVRGSAGMHFRSPIIGLFAVGAGAVGAGVAQVGVVRLRKVVIA